MRRKGVESSCIQSVGYYPKARILEVEFVSGLIYRYFEVPQSIYEGLMASPSKGSFFNDEMRDNFAWEEVH